MSKKKRFGVSQALTRGLSETIHVVENNAGLFRNVILPLSRIELDPDNPRKLAISMQDVLEGISKQDAQFDQKSEELDKLRELANTIESSGIINPIVVYKRADQYRIVAGERRCLASLLIGKQDIEARVFNEKPKGYELKLIQWVENTAREDLTLGERIGNIRDILSEYQQQHGFSETNATLLKTITGLSLPQASYYMTVLQAPEDLKAVIDSGDIRSLDKAAVIASIPSPELRQEAIQACRNGVSLKMLRQMITSKKQEVKKQSAPLTSLKRGRTVTRINMGFTLNTEVVERIVRAVLNQESYRKYGDIFSKVDWNDYDQSTRAFRKLVEILEHEMVE